MKNIIFNIIGILLLIVALAGIDFKLKPFSLRFSNPYIALGAVFIFAGIFFIYYQGSENGRKEILNDLMQAAKEKQNSTPNPEGSDTTDDDQGTESRKTK